jgi:GDPmannose 4,6-dehydratase
MRGSIYGKGIFNGKTIVQISAKYYRPAEVETLLGDATKAKTELGWEPKISFDQLVDEMVEADMKSLKI